MRRTLPLSAAALLSVALTGCNDGTYGPAAASSMSSAAAASSQQAAATQTPASSASTPAPSTSEPAAPASATAATTTAAAASPTEPAAATTAAAPDLAATVEEAITQGGVGRPTWAAPIADIEQTGDAEVRITYQEQIPNDAAREDLATKIHTFTKAEGAQLDTIILRDLSGVDSNVYCGQTICSTSIFKIDR